MIRQLKKRVVISAMISVTVVLVLIIGAINILNYQSIIGDTDKVLIYLNENDGKFPSAPSDNGFHTQIDSFLNSPEAPYETRYFTMLYKNGEWIDIDISHISAIDDKDDAISLGNKAISMRWDSGFLTETNGLYRYHIHEGEERTRITFLDCTRTMQNFYTFFAFSIAISAASLLTIFIMMMIFAAKIISPIAESYEKQKHFITDAGHDIKTPITIIDADREILEMEIGENEWLTDIKKQTKRLTKLTNDLIYLSRMEEGTAVRELSSFSISTLCTEEADSFSALAMKKNLEIKTKIESDVNINGSEEDVKKLMAILLDNAIKYAKEGTYIGVDLSKHGRFATVSISNVAENMTEEHTKKMFDRFYRADSSRSSTGGFGIGLAMAQAIVMSHNGRIYAELSPDKLLKISATFPTQYGSFKLITDFVEKIPKTVNNSLQNIANRSESEATDKNSNDAENEKDKSSEEGNENDFREN